jgi:hypothetical protein
VQKHWVVTRSAVGVALVALLVSSLCTAEVIRNQRRGYSFSFPQGWTLKAGEKDFTVAGPNSVELSELPLPPPPTQSLKDVTRFSVQSFELIWGCKPTQQKFDLSGDKWNGQVAVLEQPQKSGKTPKHMVLLVAKAGKDFRQFYLSMPANEWQQHSEQYLALLRTLKFPDR